MVPVVCSLTAVVTNPAISQFRIRPSRYVLQRPDAERPTAVEASADTFDTRPDADAPAAPTGAENTAKASNGPNLSHLSPHKYF